ncbi:MAG: flagellar hook-basal body complex protein FliE [Alphaproteobacteria bacterium]|jgi:flagellar hook-basal body complex protein FliE|nr:flagellar hook-basal body complex protein FliE [Alphaproteobacteria bacterium]
MEFQPIQFAAQQYAANKPATAPQPGESGAAFGDFASDFVSTIKHGESQAMHAMSGGADPHALVQALAQTEIAIQTAVTVRDKVVEAYQEILRMPV